MASLLPGSGPLQVYSAGFDASWELDPFGGTRRAVEAAAARADAFEANLADAQVPDFTRRRQRIYSERVGTAEQSA